MKVYRFFNPAAIVSLQIWPQGLEISAARSFVGALLCDHTGREF